MDSSLMRSPCGCLYFACHENTETDFNELMGRPCLLARCGCRLYFCNESGRNRDLSVAAQATGQTTSIPNGDYAFQEQLFGGAVPASTNLPMTVLAEPTADMPNNEVPAHALAAEHETSNRLGNPLDLDNSLFRQSPPDRTRPPYRELVPGLDRLTTFADTRTHPVVSSNENDVLSQDPVPAMDKAPNSAPYRDSFTVTVWF